MIGRFIGLGIVMVILTLVMWAALIGGGIWLIVYLLRALNVIPA